MDALTKTGRNGSYGFFYDEEICLSSKKGKQGFSAEGINPPEKAEHSFLKWDGNFTNVIRYMHVEAIYEANRYIISFDYENVVSMTGLHEEVVEVCSCMLEN